MSNLLAATLNHQMRNPATGRNDVGQISAISERNASLVNSMPILQLLLWNKRFAHTSALANVGLETWSVGATS